MCGVQNQSLAAGAFEGMFKSKYNVRRCAVMYGAVALSKSFLRKPLSPDLLGDPAPPYTLTHTLGVTPASQELLQPPIHLPSEIRVGRGRAQLRLGGPTDYEHELMDLKSAYSCVVTGTSQSGFRF
jgi:hypothetical protein